MHERSKSRGNALQVKKSGYVYIYTSNESSLSVYFDNLKVKHHKGALLEETHYYPFGLTMAGISSKAAGKLENKRKFNGIEYENSFDLNIGEAFFRTHDPQIGRWWQIDPKGEKYLNLSPYSAMGNNPISIKDPLGDILNGEDKKSANTLLNTIVGSFMGDKFKQLNSLFKIGKDGKTFSSISKKEFKSATSKLSPDEKALATGYFKAINSKETNSVQFINSKDKLTLSMYKGLGIDKNATEIAENKTGADFLKNYGGGANNTKSGGTYTLIVGDAAESVPIYCDPKAGLTSATPSTGETLAHELLGHGLSFNLQIFGQANDNNAIYSSNIYRRVQGLSTFRDGTWHGPPMGNPGGPINPQSTIPSYLKDEE
jgi:RHS repeat-associated protein